MDRRRQHVPWKAAGETSDEQSTADEVVRRTGWVFNNRRGAELDLASFVETGDHETGKYLQVFGLEHLADDEHSLVEIGSGIGRMTASFSRMFGSVTACDLDAAFLERCRQTVARFGRAERLQTVHVFDGRTVRVPRGSADLVFSYITLQHCHPDDALELTREAVRIAKPGGWVALNYRMWSPPDAFIWPTGRVVRGVWQLPVVGPRLARQRSLTRLGWQASRLGPSQVLAEVGADLAEVRLFRSPKRRPFGLPGAHEHTFEGVHPGHWWLVASVR